SCDNGSAHTSTEIQSIRIPSRIVRPAGFICGDCTGAKRDPAGTQTGIQRQRAPLGKEIVFMFGLLNHRAAQKRSNTDWLLAGYRDRSQPVMTVRLLATNNGVELFLNGPGDWPGYTFSDIDLVNGTDGRDLGGGAGEKSLVSDIQHFARDCLFDNLDSVITGDLQRVVMSVAWRDGRARRR